MTQARQARYERRGGLTYLCAGCGGDPPAGCDPSRPPCRCGRCGSYAWEPVAPSSHYERVAAELAAGAKALAKARASAGRRRRRCEK